MIENSVHPEPFNKPAHPEQSERSQHQLRPQAEQSKGLSKGATVELLVSVHAVDRYLERVAPVTPDQARAAMDCPAARIAARFGAPFVRLPTGQRLVIRHHTVITVLPAEQRPAGLTYDKEPKHG